MMTQEAVKNKADELGQKYFPDSHNIWARSNVEAQYVSFACIEMNRWTIDKIKPIIRKFLREHDFTSYIKEITMNDELIYDYNKFENDLFKAIEDGHS